MCTLWRVVNSQVSPHQKGDSIKEASTQETSNAKAGEAIYFFVNRKDAENFDEKHRDTLDYIIEVDCSSVEGRILDATDNYSLLRQSGTSPKSIVEEKGMLGVRYSMPGTQCVEVAIFPSLITDFSGFRSRTARNCVIPCRQSLEAPKYARAIHNSCLARPAANECMIMLNDLVKSI